MSTKFTLRRFQMKPKVLAISVLLVVFGLNACGGTATPTRAYPPTNTTKAERQSVPASTITDLPVGKTFDVDLTRNGTVYVLDADTDFSRVTIQTGDGVKNFAEVLQAAEVDFRGDIVVGTPNDMRDYLPTEFGAPGGDYDCGSVSCKCNGLINCLDMITDDKCQPEGGFSCNPDTGNCFCSPKS